MNKTTISLSAPTPIWARKVVRCLTWVTAAWAGLLLLGFDLTDFGVNEAAAGLVLKYMSILTGASSGLARFLGIAPIENSN